MERVRNVEAVKTQPECQAFQFPRGVQNGENVYWQMMIFVKSATNAQKFFQSHGVDTSTTSLVNISNLPSYPYQGITPKANEIHKNGLFLPAYPGLPKKDVQHIACTLKNFGNESQL
jgi:dTDP-4-amino-4,6-dideoxygalactose transaminase